MTAALLDPPAVSVRRPQPRALLHVQRTDITFGNVAPDRLQISVAVHNRGHAPSDPTTLTLQAAPLGAFLPWQDLATLPVPAIEPSGRVQVRTEVPAPPAKPLGQFSNVPPRKLAAAVSSRDEEPSGSRATGNTMGDLLVGLLRPHGKPTRPGPLPADPLDLLARPGTHWAGNINVLIGRKPVERHLAQALRIYPGKTNLAVFFVGSRPDAYRFELTGSGASWDAALFDLTRLPSLLAPRCERNQIRLSTWVKMDGGQTVLLALCPPEHCEQGAVDVHVRQKSSGREAVVEFSLDRNAAGAGCYVV